MRFRLLLGHSARGPASSCDIGVYGDFLSELDWSVGEILKTLDEKQLTDNTLVILASDNGGIVEALTKLLEKYLREGRSAPGDRWRPE